MSKKVCSIMAGDMQRLASVAIQAAEGHKIKGAIFGPTSRSLYVEFECEREGKWGPGTCVSYRVRRSGPGANGLKPMAYTGNLHGLTRQLSRDIARIWGCQPGPDTGFEGSRKKPRKRRRR